MTQTDHMSQGSTLAFFLCVVAGATFFIIWRNSQTGSTASLTLDEQRKKRRALVVNELFAASGVSSLVLVYHVIDLAEGQGWNLSVAGTVAAISVPIFLLLVGLFVIVKSRPLGAKGKR